MMEMFNDQSNPVFTVRELYRKKLRERIFVAGSFSPMKEKTNKI